MSPDAEDRGRHNTTGPSSHLGAKILVYKLKLFTNVFISLTSVFFKQLHIVIKMFCKMSIDAFMFQIDSLNNDDVHFGLCRTGRKKVLVYCL